MNKKSVLIIVVSIIVILLCVLGFIFYPKYVEQKNINNLNNEISLINEYLNDKIDYQKLDDYLKKDITSLKMNEVEKSLENYVNDLLNNYNDLKDNINIKKLDINQIDEKIVNNINNEKDKINEIKVKLEDIIINKDNYLTNKEFTNLYKELTEKINVNYDDKISEYNNDSNQKMEVISFLNNNKNWKIEDNKVIFTKRNTFNEYSKLNNNSLDYELIKDNISPVITASDITITKGNSINIKDKIKCIDNVDDKVDCIIEGSYDTKKVGNYNIKILASDTNGNKANKTIKLIVKEKIVNNKKMPYYVEVLRNQNVVIVYGLDSNNNYTKIVKVFVCSVGKNGKTPTGTFKTSDKSSWGWLVGNVYGQYYTRIVGDILFHSVPYFKKAKNQLEWEEYNKLGSAASKGCVRLAVRDVKWLYDNLARGTTVKIYDGNLPNGVSKPSSIKIEASNPNRGWDPTDPDKNNPWKK